VVRKGVELRDTLRHQSPPQEGGGVKSYGTLVSTGALFNEEARSGAVGHIVEW
jgi:hypothetical protein